MIRPASGITAMIAAIVVLAACGPQAAAGRATVADESLSCEELAQRRATEQYDTDTAAAEQRLGGAMEDSRLRRQMRAMDAEARWREVYEECLRLRTPSAPPAETP